MTEEDWEVSDEDIESSGASTAPRSLRQKFFKNMRLGVSFALVLFLGLVGGYFIGNHGVIHAFSSNVSMLSTGLDPTPDPNADMTDFWEVWNELNAQYVITHASSTLPTEQERIYGAIQGLTAAYGDPYTVFFPPKQAKEFQDNISGNFTGVGMELGENNNNVLEVISPLVGTPSAKAGILTGDLIVGINGKSTQGVSTDQAVELIRGPKGTTVDFTIVRNGKQIDIKVVRDTIEVPEILYSLDAKTGVYTIALYEFTQNSSDLFDKAFTAFKASGSKDLVIDLRGNPGGYLDSAVAIASHFLPKGSVIVTEDYEGKQTNDVLTSTGTNDLPSGTKVAILIDGGSASASEILSGALQDHHVATLIGAQSFGKGSVQQLVNVDGGSLKVTIARWLTPNGNSIMGNGITPDIIVPDSTSTTMTPETDPQILRAVQFFTTGK